MQLKKLIQVPCHIQLDNTSTNKSKCDVFSKGQFLLALSKKYLIIEYYCYSNTFSSILSANYTRCYASNETFSHSYIHSIVFKLADLVELDASLYAMDFDGGLHSPNHIWTIDLYINSVISVERISQILRTSAAQ